SEVWGPKRLLVTVFASIFLTTVLAAQTGSRVVDLSFDDARPVLQTLAAILPSDLKSQDVNALASSWPEWMNKNDADTRARLERVPGAEFAERSRLYRARGLSSDTSLLPDYAVEQALRAMRAKGAIDGPIRRVAVIGPGLDFTDKQEGYDFYPPQTLQPFAI